MIFKGPSAKVVHRLGYKFESDVDGNLTIDFDKLVKRATEVDEEGNEYTVKEKVSKEEIDELKSALVAYGFTEVKATK